MRVGRGALFPSLAFPCLKRGHIHGNVSRLSGVFSCFFLFFLVFSLFRSAGLGLVCVVSVVALEFSLSCIPGMYFHVLFALKSRPFRKHTKYHDIGMRRRGMPLFLSRIFAFYQAFDTWFGPYTRARHSKPLCFCIFLCCFRATSVSACWSIVYWAMAR